jgi:hypothetical protein
VVDVVHAVRKRFARTDVRFIHVEVYEGNNPAPRAQSLVPGMAAEP